MSVILQRGARVGLKVEDALRCIVKLRNTTQKGKYARREKIYIFKCSNCPSELGVHKSDLRKASGRCRPCADKDTGVITSYRERKRPYEALYNKFVYDRKRAGQDSNLTFDDFLEFTAIDHCHYCDESVFWAERSLQANGYAYNLDRMDNTRGYFKDNCVVCCWECNETKGSRYSYAEFVLLSPSLRKIKRKRCSS